jgi:hypothetical protein
VGWHCAGLLHSISYAAGNADYQQPLHHGSLDQYSRHEYFGVDNHNSHFRRDDRSAYHLDLSEKTGPAFFTGLWLSRSHGLEMQFDEGAASAATRL